MERASLRVPLDFRRRSEIFRIFRFCLILCGVSLTARATSVMAPTFPELVAEAQVIVRAKVADVHSAWVASPEGRVIKTYVTFEIRKRLKGETPDQLTLAFLGGDVDGEGMQVVGMP